MIDKLSDDELIDELARRLRHRGKLTTHDTPPIADYVPTERGPMTQNDLIEKLKAMLNAGTLGDNTRAIATLFGIVFDKEIETSGASVPKIGDGARIKNVEINIGRKLADFVTVRPDVLSKWRP